MLRWFAITSIFFLFISCKETKQKFVVAGNTQGTTYQIIYSHEDEAINKIEIDSLLHAFDLSLSTYIDSSVVSRINESGLGSSRFYDPTGFFKRCYENAYNVFKKSDGAFNPCLYPIIKLHGFYGKEAKMPDSSELISALKHTSFEKGDMYDIAFKEDYIHVLKSDSLCRFDFNAIAQGLAVDVLFEFLASRGISDMYVEIGGELRVKGKNPDGNSWNIGIDQPVETNKEMDGNRELSKIITISDRAIATSGNYRKFYEKDGVKHAHTIDPKTGFSVAHSLLSATVVANDAATADAYATVFMVLGLEKSKKFIEQHKELKLEVYFIFDDRNGALKSYASEGFKQYL